jgi:hypothetical protein
MVHEEYLVPGDNPGPRLDVNKVSLPASMKKTMKITELEYTAARIPNNHWPASYIPSTEHDKENVLSSSSCISKHSTLNSAGSLPSKQVRITVPALQLSRTCSIDQFIICILKSVFLVFLRQNHTFVLHSVRIIVCFQCYYYFVFNLGYLHPMCVNYIE